MSLKKFRKEYRLTQEQLADALGVSRITIARLESDSTGVKCEIVKRLITAFDLSLEDAWAVICEPKPDKTDGEPS